jgi:ubiquinone/menaquinone biosynthesis C-methylase UbiE
VPEVRSYVLGNAESEHERLIRQATRLAPYTERFFREAGLAEGQRVLDIGSGVGDVAMLAARLVGPSGEVVGIERDPYSIARARARTTEAGFRNVSFRQCDVADVAAGEGFDGVVGRYILMFLPDPIAVLRCLSAIVRPGRTVAFQEVSWACFHALSTHLPLWSATGALACEVIRRSGANVEMGFDLPRVFQDAGLPTPTMHMVAPLGNNRPFIGLMCDLLGSLWPEAERFGIRADAIGGFDTLAARLHAEVAASKGVAVFPALVGGWVHK